MFKHFEQDGLLGLHAPHSIETHTLLNEHIEGPKTPTPFDIFSRQPDIGGPEQTPVAQVSPVLSILHLLKY